MSQLDSNIELLARHLPDIKAVAYKQAKLSLPSIGHARSPEPPLPVDPHGVILAQNVVAALKQARDKNTYKSPRLARLIEKTTWLKQETNTYLQREEETRVIGACPTCQRTIAVPDDTAATVCECGDFINCTTLRQHRAYRLAHLGLTLTPSEAVTTLRNHTGLKLNRKTIHTWARAGKLHQQGTDEHGWPLYDLNEILNQYFASKK